MNAPQTVPPRRRLQELQAIPERLRTEAEWDELHELEISLAPGNRADAPPPRARGDAPPPRSRPEGAPQRPRPSPSANPANPRSSEGGEVRKTFRKRHKKPPKPAEPQ